eukprot:tig00020614_g12120.t1
MAAAVAGPRKAQGPKAPLLVQTPAQAGPAAIFPTKKGASGYSVTASGTFSAKEIAVNACGIISAKAGSGGSLVTRLEDLELREVIGRGAGGVVHACRHTPSGRIVACKVMTLNDNDSDRVEEVFKETMMLYQNTCDHIISFHNCFYKDASFYLITEYMDQGSLSDVMKRNGSFSEDILADIAQQVLFGVRYVHEERKQIHRDIKPSNILMNSRGQVKLADFGICSRVLNTQTQVDTFIGTIQYMAPERVRSDKGYKYPADIWALGMTLLECAVGKYPLGVPNSYWEMLHHIEAFDASKIPMRNYSPEFRKFILACLERDPEKRATVEQLLAHPFIRKFASNGARLSEWILNVLVQSQARGEAGEADGSPTGLSAGIARMPIGGSPHEAGAVMPPPGAKRTQPDTYNFGSSNYREAKGKERRPQPLKAGEGRGGGAFGGGKGSLNSTGRSASSNSEKASLSEGSEGSQPPSPLDDLGLCVTGFGISTFRDIAGPAPAAPPPAAAAPHAHPELASTLKGRPRVR